MVRCIVLSLFFFPSSVFAVAMCELGVDTSARPESLPITYKANSKVPYSNARARPFSMLVFHDPGSTQCDPLAMLKYGQTYDKRRDGMFGYHFYIARDGTIYQGAPLSKRTNHVAGDNRRTPLKYSNSSAIGIALMCGHQKIPEAQLRAAVRLGHILQVAYRIPSSRVFGHGELQYNRLPNEGIIAARATRSTSALHQETLSVFKKEVVTCEVAGAPPAPCAGNTCEIFSRTPQRTIDGLPPGLYKILTGNTGYELPNRKYDALRIPIPKDKYTLSPQSISQKEMQTDADAWGYFGGSPKGNGTTTETHFGNPLDVTKFK